MQTDSERGIVAGSAVADRGTGWTRAAALSGVLFTVLVVFGAILNTSEPDTNSSATKIQHWVLTHKGQLGGSGLFTVLGVIVGLVFFGYVRAVFRRAGAAEWLGSVFFGGVIIFAISGTLSAGIDFALSDNPKALSAGSLQVLNTIAANLNWAPLCAGLAVLYLTAGIIIHRTRVLPAWLAWVSWLFALLSASFFLAFIPFMGMAIWACVVGIILATRNPSLDAAR